PLEAPTDLWLGVTFSPDGKRLAGVARDRALHVFDADARKEVLQVREEATTALAAAFGPGGKQLHLLAARVTTGTTPGRPRGQLAELNTGDAASGKRAGRAILLPSGVRQAVFAPGGARFATRRQGGGGRPGAGVVNQVWDAETGKPMAEFDGGDR